MTMKSTWVVTVVILVVCSDIASDAAFAQAEERPKPLIFLDLPMPELIGIPSDWLNTEGQPLIFERNRVYVVHFWTFGCINCKRNLPAYAAWQNKYATAPLTIVGIHTPETEKEKNTQNVVKETKALGITYPVLLDTQAVNWKRWQQNIWPTVYLIDKRGHVRAYWMGELEWEGAGGTRIMEDLINYLLQEPYWEPPEPVEKEKRKPLRSHTPYTHPTPGTIKKAQ